MWLKWVWGLLKSAADAWVNDNAPRLGAALSFYTVFAISPLFIIVMFIASLWFDRSSVQHALYGELGSLVGPQGARAIQTALSSSLPHQEGLVASIIAIGTVLITATGVFIELQGDLNTVWGVEQKSGLGVWRYVRDRLLSFAMVVGIGFLLLVSLVVSAAVAALGRYVGALVPGLGMVWMLINAAISFGVITVLFAMIFKVLPDVKIAWRDVWIGAVVTAFLFTGGKFLLGLYLGRSSTVSGYGAAGSLVLILLWVYYSAQILFFGAEITQAYANRFGVRLEPKASARWIRPPSESQRISPAEKAAPRLRRWVELISELRQEVEALRRQVRH
jgi:membrane protein